MKGGLGNLLACAAAATAALLPAGCGDASAGNEDAPYTVEVVRAQFPALQRLAEQSTFEIVVRNAGDQTIPNLAVTLRGFGPRDDDSEQPRRSLWLTDVSPAGTETSATDTWAAGALGAGKTVTLRWVVTPISPGARTLSYELAPGLEGQARAVLANGHAARGSIAVRVTDKAPKARVDPRTGEVIRERTAQDG